MNPRPFYIVSDLHLGAVPRATEHAFRDFLSHVADSAGGLLINGDLFDFWFEYRTVIPARHYRVLAALADTVERGVPVWFVGGNHDAWGGEFLREEIGITTLEGPIQMELAGRRALVAHGDGVGRGDLGYRILRRFIRHPVTVRAFRALHPDLGARIAGVASTTEAKAGSDAAAAGRAAYLRQWAHEQFRSTPELDLVVAGHAHVPLVEEVAPGKFYANAGDWINHYTYLVLPPAPAAPQLHSWPAASGT